MCTLEDVAGSLSLLPPDRALPAMAFPPSAVMQSICHDGSGVYVNDPE
jgi:hypothetical protein